MQIWVSGRAWGKTTRLVEYMRGHGGTEMVCHTAQKARQLMEQNPGIDPERFLTLQEALEPGHRRTLLIDDLDLILYRLFPPGVEPEVATATGVLLPRPPNFENWTAREMLRNGESHASEIDAKWREP